jgi:peptide-methionine (R)-S-oxide reductase
MPEQKFTPEELKNRLNADQYRITQEKGTEMPFSGEYVDNHETGIYQCIVCQTMLFDSNAKFDSGTGWPSFQEPANLEHVELVQDNSHGMQRTEVKCKTCGAHLGHVFPDGPGKTGERYCINSCSLNFKKKI